MIGWGVLLALLAISLVTFRLLGVRGGKGHDCEERGRDHVKPRELV